ncbi:hypothetical protein FR932_01655 [Moritella marina ATCC 15381]|uniref:Nitrate/nitrite sensing protein domain-containing protein n=2 Tax=Moritella marina TaxID=90736 RepID=A0A5J6WS30_MORMI|nr:hypothetical protein FR932_01655 [Moritella marina ATCC 15381]
MTSHSTLFFTSTVVLLALCCLAYLFLILQKQKQCRQQLQIDGLVKLNTIRKLLTRVQQHRGLSNGVLHGEEDLKPRLKKLADSIDAIQQDIGDNYPGLLAHDRWQAMLDHWQRLAVDCTNLHVRNNLEQHNKLVLNLLYLIDDIAFATKLHKLNNTHSESIQFLWQELLFTAESIAQIRALGTGIAAAKICTRAERIRLSYLCQSLEQSINIQQNQDYHLKISHLLKVIDNEIIITRPTIKAGHFFNIATESIDMILASFDEQLNNVEYKLHISTTENHPS